MMRVTNKMMINETIKNLNTNTWPRINGTITFCRENLTGLPIIQPGW